MIKSLRKIIFRKPVATQQNLFGKKMLITGASPDSIGYATALELLRWGAEVTVTRRSGTANLLEAFKHELTANEVGRLFGHDLDISNAATVKAFSQWYKNERKELDVLINCAGIHLDLLSKWETPSLSEDGFEIQWRTNYLGTTHLSHELLPLLLESAHNTGNARIVNVVSMLHKKGSNSEFFNPTKPYNSWNAYGQSKLGLIHFTFELQRRYSKEGLHAYCLHPGEVFTNVAGKGLAGNPLIEGIRNFFAPVEAFMLMTPFEGAQTQLLCATAPEAEGGHYYRNCAVARSSEDTKDAGVAQRLWDQNIDWIKSL